MSHDVLAVPPKLNLNVLELDGRDAKSFGDESAKPAKPAKMVCAGGYETLLVT